MEPKVFKNILENLKSVGIDTIGLHMVGEPFMYKNLENLMEIIRDCNLKVCLSTNGQFPERIEELYRKFPDVTNLYRFSIDAATRGTYEYIRRGASFDRLIKSLEVINRINGGKKGYRIALSIDSILNTDNLPEIPLFFEVFGKYCWPNSINFHLISGHSPDPTYFRKTFPFPNLIRYNVPCRLPFSGIFFTFDGKATLCCADYHGELVIGDIKDNSIMELWNSEKAEEIRKKHLNPVKMDIHFCKMCFGPHHPVSDITNEYIHLLIAHRPRLTKEEFNEKLASFLNNINAALAHKGLALFKRSVISALNRL
jgi:MoaA/NifB/PqqE/SkfB family radical SAM enzyme